MKKQKIIIWIVMIAVVVTAIALAIFLPRKGEVKDAGGSMSIICPIKIYEVGEIIKSPCPLRPHESCIFTDANNCQYNMKNTSDQFVTKGLPVMIVKQKIQGTIQYLEVNIPE